MRLDVCGCHAANMFSQKVKHRSLLAAHSLFTCQLFAAIFHAKFWLLFINPQIITTHSIYEIDFHREGDYLIRCRMEGQKVESSAATTDQSVTNGADQKGTTSAGTKRKAEWFETDTHVYVTGLPSHTTEEEFIELMNKYGIIAKKNDLGRPHNIKLYRNEDGSFKGDARCGYARKESADMAIELLDGYLYEGKHELHCERAHFQMKGDYDPSRKPRLDKRTKLNNKKKLQKLLSWEPEVGKEVRQKKVVLKNMFSPEECLEDAELILFLKEEVETMCTSLQFEAKRIDVYDKHPEGVITIVFATPEQAEMCVKKLDKYYYDKRIISAELWDGITKYKIKETDEESQKRLEKWHEDIQKSDDEDHDSIEKATGSSFEHQTNGQREENSESIASDQNKHSSPT